MKLLTALTGVSLLAGGLIAGPYDQAIRQAQNVSTKATSNNRQLEDNPPSAVAPKNNSQMDPALQATLKNIADLRTDFAAIGNAAGTNVLAAQQRSLTNHLITAAQGTKPRPESVAKLTADLTAALAGKESFRVSQPKLAQYVHAVFNGSHLTAGQLHIILDAAQKILKDGGASAEETANVVGDLKAIAGETK